MDGVHRKFSGLKCESARLETFAKPRKWPVAFISPEECARAGFYYLQEDDKVKCAFCDGILQGWEEGDDPLAEHWRHVPNCPFIQGVPVGNVPLGRENEIKEEIVVERRGYDVCGRFAPEDLGQLSLSPKDASVLESQKTKAIPRSVGVTACQNGPMHKTYVTPNSRLQSFKNWNQEETGQSPEKLAEAGFFYFGVEDYVKCFYCGACLQQWEPGEDPWEEHQKWIPNCTFVILNKKDGTSSSNSSILTSQDKMGDKDSLSECQTSKSKMVSSEHKPSEPVSDVTHAVLSENSDPNRDEELRQLKQQTLCKVCLENQVGIVFLPCGHLVTCPQCATSVTNCPMCRQPIEAVVRSFLS